MDEMRKLTWTAALAGACLLALVRGGRDEHRVATLLLCANLATVVVARGPTWTWQAHALALVDVALLGCLLLVGLKSNRWWPMTAIAFMGNSVVMLLALLVYPGLRNSAFWTASGVWSYLVLLALIVGTLLEGRRATSTLDWRRRPT